MISMGSRRREAHDQANFNDCNGTCYTGISEPTLCQSLARCFLQGSFAALEDRRGTDLKRRRLEHAAKLSGRGEVDSTLERISAFAVR